MISILVPAYNEAKSIRRTLVEICRTFDGYDHEVVVLEDGSTNGTKNILLGLHDELPIRLLMNDRRKGFRTAMQDGIRAANGSTIFTLDGDGQFDPREFSRAYPMLPQYDMVIGRRTRRPEPVHRILIARFFNIILRLLFQIPVSDADCTFRVFKREVATSVLRQKFRLPYSFNAEFTIRAFSCGYRLSEIPISHRPREGESQIYSPKKLPLVLAREIIGLIRLRLDPSLKAFHS